MGGEKEKKKHESETLQIQVGQNQIVDGAVELRATARSGELGEGLGT